MLLIEKVYSADIQLGLPLKDGSSGGYSSFDAYFMDLTKIMVYTAAIASVLVIAIAGAMYIQSRGDPQKTALAKELIAGVFYGMGIIVFLRLIMQTLSR